MHRFARGTSNTCAGVETFLLRFFLGPIVQVMWLATCPCGHSSSVFPGNFWTGKCATLVLPTYDFDAFTRKILPIIKSPTLPSWENRNSSQTVQHLNAHLYNSYLGDTVGSGRFAAEHWVANHPRLVPCDMSQTSDTWRLALDRPLNWSLAPRYSVWEAKHLSLNVAIIRGTPL